jgi:hypothetical protein
MRPVLGLVLLVGVAACATTSANLPEAQRSRTFLCAPNVVWEEASSAVIDADFTITDRRQADGVIRAHSKGNVTDFRGYDISIVVTDVGGGKTRVDVSAENASEDQRVGLGFPAAQVREYVSALDRRMASAPCK